MVFIYSYAVYGDNVKDAVLLSRPVLTDMGLFNTYLWNGLSSNYHETQIAYYK